MLAIGEAVRWASLCCCRYFGVAVPSARQLPAQVRRPQRQKRRERDDNSKWPTERRALIRVRCIPRSLVCCPKFAASSSLLWPLGVAAGVEFGDSTHREQFGPPTTGVAGCRWLALWKTDKLDLTQLGASIRRRNDDAETTTTAAKTTGVVFVVMRQSTFLSTRHNYHILNSTQLFCSVQLHCRLER